MLTFKLDCVHLFELATVAFYANQKNKNKNISGYGQCGLTYQWAALDDIIYSI